MEQSIVELRRAVAERNHLEVQRMLVEGANPHPKLWFPAIQTGDVNLCTLLLFHGLDPNDSAGDRKPLHYAVEGAHRDILELLLRSGANPNAVDQEGMTALDVCCEFAADEKDPEIIQVLLNAGSDVPFHTALRLGDLDLVRRSLDLMPELIDRIPQAGKGTPLMIAARCGRLEVVKELLARGASVHMTSPRDPATGKGGNTALWCASQGRRTGRSVIAKTLIEAGSLVDFHGEYGETPLHVAVAWRHVDVGRQLLEHGADPNSVTDRGETPLDFAVKWGFKEMEHLVRAYGGKTIAVSSAVVIA